MFTTFNYGIVSVEFLFLLVTIFMILKEKKATIKHELVGKLFLLCLTLIYVSIGVIELVQYISIYAFLGPPGQRRVDNWCS